MKDIISFPILGYDKENPLEGLVVGSVLYLENDPNYGETALAVKWDEQIIGYVPNRGRSCTSCFHHVSPEDGYCSNCGASWEHFVDGGLSTRIVLSKAKICGCFIDKIEPGKLPMAKLILE